MVRQIGVFHYKPRYSFKPVVIGADTHGPFWIRAEGE
jgi:hypothetical protein